MLRLAAVLILVSGCRPRPTYETHSAATFVAPGRYIVEARCNPISVAMQWVHARAREVCRGRYQMEGGAATNETRTWTDSYGRTHAANFGGYVATAICDAKQSEVARTPRPTVQHSYCTPVVGVDEAVCFPSFDECSAHRQTIAGRGGETGPCLPGR